MPSSRSDCFQDHLTDLTGARRLKVAYPLINIVAIRTSDSRVKPCFRFRKSHTGSLIGTLLFLDDDWEGLAKGFAGSKWAIGRSVQPMTVIPARRNPVGCRAEDAPRFPLFAPGGLQRQAHTYADEDARHEAELRDSHPKDLARDENPTNSHPTTCGKATSRQRCNCVATWRQESASREYLARFD